MGGLDRHERNADGQACFPFGTTGKLRPLGLPWHSDRQRSKHRSASRLRKQRAFRDPSLAIGHLDPTWLTRAHEQVGGGTPRGGKKGEDIRLSILDQEQQWYDYQRGVALHVESQRGSVTTCHEYVSPTEATAPGEAVLFKSDTVQDG